MITLRPAGAPSASDQSNISPDPGADESMRMASAPYSSARLEVAVAGRERPG